MYFDPVGQWDATGERGTIWWFRDRHGKGSLVFRRSLDGQKVFHATYARWDSWRHETSLTTRCRTRAVRYAETGCIDPLLDALDELVEEGHIEVIYRPILSSRENTRYSITEKGRAVADRRGTASRKITRA